MLARLLVRILQVELTLQGFWFDAGLQRRIEFECSSQKYFFVPNVVIANAIVTAAAQWGKKQRKKKIKIKERGERRGLRC
jgi:hypothetical protein